MKIKNIIISIALLVSVTLLVYFICVSYRTLNFNSDSAVKVLLAKEIYDEHRFFPKDWVYFNGDIFVLFGHLFIIPLLLIFPAGFTVHAISGLVSVALIFMSLNLVIGMTRPALVDRLIVNLIIAGGISLPITEHMFGQVSYGFIFFLICMMLWSTWNILYESNNKKLHLILFFVINLFVFWSNPQRAITFIFLPLLITICIYKFKSQYQEATRHVKNFYILNIVLIVSALIGIILYYLTLKVVIVDSGYSILSWLSIAGMVERIGRLFGGIIFLFGGEPLAERKVLSLVGMYEAFRVSSAFLFIGIIPISVSRIYKSGSGARVFLLSFSLISFSIITFFLITTNIYDERYLIPSILFLIIVIFLDNSLTLKNNFLVILIKVYVALGLVSNAVVINTNYWNTYNAITAKRVHYPLYGSVIELKDYLLTSNLKYGYAEYWRAGLLTVLSDEDVKVRSITIKNGLPTPNYALGSKKWFSADYYQGDTFIILTPEEDTSVNWDLMALKGFEPIKKLYFLDYRIYVFDKNFAQKLPGW